MPGDVVLDGAKLKGYKSLHTYRMSAGEGAPCMGDRERVRREEAQTQGATGESTSWPGSKDMHLRFSFYAECVSF